MNASTNNGPSALSCPKCGGPTEFSAPFCVFCRSPLTWGAVPPLSRGAILFHSDATREALPRRTALVNAIEERTPHGVQITCPGGKAFTGELGPPRRHGCMVVRAVAVDPGTAIGVAVRRQTIPGTCGYSLLTVPYYRTVDLSRYASTATDKNMTALHESEFHPCVLGLGQMNEIELRCADSIFQIFINGQQVATCIDPALGFGGFGWRLESMNGQPARAIIQSTTLYGVT